MLLEIPNDIARLRREKPGLAEHSRTVVAQAFQAAFAAGYRAVHFVRDDTIGSATEAFTCSSDYNRVA